MGPWARRPGPWTRQKDSGIAWPGRVGESGKLLPNLQTTAVERSAGNYGERQENGSRSIHDMLPFAKLTSSSLSELWADISISLHLRSTAEAATKSPIFTTIYHKQLVSFTGGVNPSLREEVLALEGASENLDPSDRSIGPDIVIWILVICL
uniref:Predicted protein n=1 Tax=Physcomitrium patens TaxID=3218 RepID=A9U1U7_PHYPA